ncbi:MAG: hypothetical protein UFG06_13550 [Lachnospiraceae bacterium]|nr:hypothetical protein [Lachnospiraceae bacterium]
MLLYVVPIVFFTIVAVIQIVFACVNWNKKELDLTGCWNMEVTYGELSYNGGIIEFYVDGTLSINGDILNRHPMVYSILNDKNIKIGTYDEIEMTYQYEIVSVKEIDKNKIVLVGLDGSSIILTRGKTRGKDWF